MKDFVSSVLREGGFTEIEESSSGKGFYLTDRVNGVRVNFLVSQENRVLAAAAGLLKKSCEMRYEVVLYLIENVGPLERYRAILEVYESKSDIPPELSSRIISDKELLRNFFCYNLVVKIAAESIKIETMKRELKKRETLLSQYTQTLIEMNIPVN
jgi:hypothetical protein